MIRTVLRLGIGVGLTALGALALREAWGPAIAAYAALFLGLAVLVVAGWRWLERDRDRLLRFSDEHRLRAFAPPKPPETRPTASSAIEAPAPARPEGDSDARPAPAAEVVVGPPAAK